MKLIREQLQKLGHTLLGTADSIESGLVRIGLDDDDYDVSDLEDQLLDINVERCRGCDWWHESGELSRDDDGEDDDGCCDQCVSSS